MWSRMLYRTIDEENLTKFYQSKFHVCFSSSVTGNLKKEPLIDNIARRHVSDVCKSDFGHYLLPFWNCDIFFTAIKIRILKNGRNSIVFISKTKSRRYIFLCIFGKSMLKSTTSRIFMKKSIGTDFYRGKENITISKR
jgi:hypothetical protein